MTKRYQYFYMKHVICQLQVKYKVHVIIDMDLETSVLALILTCSLHIFTSSGYRPFMGLLSTS